MLKVVIVGGKKFSNGVESWGCLGRKSFRCAKKNFAASNDFSAPARASEVTQKQ